MEGLTVTGTGIPAGTDRVVILSTGRVRVRVTILCYGYGSGSKNAVPADLYKRPYHIYTETTALTFHPCPNLIQNLPPHISHPFPKLSIIHAIHGYAMLCFQVQRTPIIHAWGFCCNSHKSEVWQSCFLRLLDLENGTAFLFQFANAHLLPNLSQY